MDSTSRPRLIAYVAASLGTLLLIFGPIIMSWSYAKPDVGKPRLRLRWHMITKNEIARGTQIKMDDVTWTLGRVPATDPVIPTSKTVVGKYAKSDIGPNWKCVNDLLSDLAPADPPSGGVVVPIEVKTSDVSSLKPGMRLVFVKEGKEIQPRTTLVSKQNHPGLLLLSMTPSTNDAGDTTLLVQIIKSELESVPLLLNGTWRPVILGASEPVVQEQPPVQAKVKRKPVKRRPRRKA
jgi:hypothetical protein